jgi:hypothetical protein
LKFRHDIATVEEPISGRYLLYAPPNQQVWQRCWWCGGWCTCILPCDWDFVFKICSVLVIEGFYTSVNFIHLFDHLTRSSCEKYNYMPSGRNLWSCKSGAALHVFTSVTCEKSIFSLAQPNITDFYWVFEFGVFL